MRAWAEMRDASRMEGEVMACTVTLGWAWSAAGRRLCVGSWWTRVCIHRYDNRDTGISTSYPPCATPHTAVKLAEDAVGILDPTALSGGRLGI